MARQVDAPNELCFLENEVKDSDHELRRPTIKRFRGDVDLLWRWWWWEWHAADQMLCRTLTGCFEMLESFDATQRLGLTMLQTGRIQEPCTIESNLYTIACTGDLRRNPLRLQRRSTLQ